MPDTFFHVLTRFLMGLSLAITLAATFDTSAYAQTSWTPPAGTRGWCTPVAPHSTANGCVGSPQESCLLQHDEFNPGAQFLGYMDTDLWYVKSFMWSSGGSLPSAVYFQCESFVLRVPPGICTNEQVVPGQCKANGGGNPDQEWQIVQDYVQRQMRGQDTYPYVLVG
jgi:hypothetical protein